MKQLIISLAVIMLLQSCGTGNYFQHYETKSGDLKVKNEAYFFENEDLKIIYDLWADYGKLTFTITNKTDEILSIDLSKSFFVVNEVAYDYYKDVQIGKTTSTSSDYLYLSQYMDYSQTKDVLNSQGFGESSTYTINPQKYFRIPSGYKKQISKYNLVNDYFRECSIKIYPGRRDDASKEYTKEDTPFRYSNILTYNIGENEKEIENSFYVSKIKNYRGKDYFENVDLYECGYKYGVGLAYLYKNSRNFFYKYYMSR